MLTKNINICTLKKIHLFSHGRLIIIIYKIHMRGCEIFITSNQITIVINGNHKLHLQIIQFYVLIKLLYWLINETHMSNRQLVACNSYGDALNLRS